MIVPGSANALMLGQSSATGYNLTNSVRIRASASAYFNRTPSTTSGTQQYTISLWCKRGKLGSYQNILGSACPNPPFGNTNDGLRFNSSDQLEMLGRGGNDIYVVPSMVFRDPSAWYHIVVAVDTTQVTSSNRVKIYVNGSQVTSFASATYPVLGYTMLGFNVSGYANSIGSDPTALGTSVFDSYMAEINVISGSQQAVTAFGENNATTGVWQPKAYTGTYGTNGYYLKFTDIATTSGSNAGLGKDFSGNGNYWTTNNISVTSGVTYDAMTDVPTLTSATAANYAVLNPLDALGASPTGGNLNLTSSGGYYAQTRSSMYFDVTTTTGYYAEFTMNGSLQDDAVIGIMDNSALSTGTLNAGSYNLVARGSGGGNTWWTANSGGYVSNTSVSEASGQVIGVAVKNGKLYFAINNTWVLSGNPTAETNPAFTGLTGQMAFLVKLWQSNATSANFGQRPFTYTPPTGYVALNTYNLPTSTITNGRSVMDVNLWSGTSATQVINNSDSGTTGFKPDLLWLKQRNGTNPNLLSNSIVGSTTYLQSNATAAEGTSATSVTSFNSNGFTLGADVSGAWNTTGGNYVGWQWNAGSGSSSTNTNGSITSTVSVNPTAGFSIVSYTGTGSSATVGHGLGVAPSFIVCKVRNNAGYDWNSYHISLGATQYINLNTTAAAASASSVWNNTTPTSSVFSVANNGGTNGSGNTIVAYCWSEIAGFSKFGSYTGNGSADGTFVYTGFRPKYILRKRTDTTAYWVVYDTTRNPYNAANLDLYPNDSSAEATGNDMDILSNGFKLRSAGSNIVNASGGTYIYAAFAENPFKNSLAR